MSSSGPSDAPSGSGSNPSPSNNNQIDLYSFVQMVHLTVDGFLVCHNIQNYKPDLSTANDTTRKNWSALEDAIGQLNTEAPKVVGTIQRLIGLIQQVSLDRKNIKKAIENEKIYIPTLADKVDAALKNFSESVQQIRETDVNASTLTILGKLQEGSAAVLTQIGAKAIEQLSKEIGDDQANISKLQQDVVDLTVGLSQIDSNITFLKNDVNTTQILLDGAQNQVLQYKQQIDSINAQIRDIGSDKTIEEIRKTGNERLEQDRQKLDAENTDYNTKVATYRAKQDQIEEDLKTNLARLQKELSEI